MYPITFLTSYLLLVFCHFGAAEPPPSHGYGPPSPVEFGSNEVSSHEQPSLPYDFGNFGSYSSGSPSSYSAPSGAYGKSGPGFGTHFSNVGSNYKVSPSKGGVSSSYISVVHGNGNSGSPSKVRPVAYSGASKSPTTLVNAYNSPSFGGSPAAYLADGKGYGSSNSYSSAEVPSFGSSFPKGFGTQSSSYTGNYEPYSGSEYNKGYESGGASDEVASYTSGGPSYATYTGSSKIAFNPNFSHGSRGSGNAYSTSNVNIGGKVTGHGNFHQPSYGGTFKPSGSKNYNRYSSPTKFASNPNTYGANPLLSSESGYSSRALKAGYSSDSPVEYSSGEESNLYNGGFRDGAGFKVQSSYSTG